ncbi:hypothetical protein K1T71_007951 [Dendrolimus kikuchii]|uniref:Uncharacterized protein n=1 Tax=Dendrolimus kikuchii TaxID=765133 RepID=A0ACC1CZR0_9NEOP|nr:hypothetical protein K1T71_007951 [Dendrolimus kikuchii]
MDEENITLRKKKRSISLNDLSNDSSLFETTMMSLPNTSLNQSQIIIDLNERIRILIDDKNELNTNLLSAHQEIDNLNMENLKLRDDIEKYIKKIDMYNKMNNTTLTPISGRKKILVRSKFLSTPLKSPITSEQGNSKVCKKNGQSPTTFQHTHDENPATPKSDCNMKSYEKEAINKLPREKCLSYCNTVLHSDTTSHLKRRIIIIADDQGRNMQKMLQRIVGEEYTVKCFWKPGANLQEVLQAERFEISTLNSDEFVIVLGAIPQITYNMLSMPNRKQ